MNIDVARWYADKIEITLNYHKKKYNQDITDATGNKGKKYISWQYISRAIEKNDFWFKKLYFKESKVGYELLTKLKESNVEI
jgi:predicted phosphoadenosine phosphosulfate sulfurtransferase